MVKNLGIGAPITVSIAAHRARAKAKPTARSAAFPSPQPPPHSSPSVASSSDSLLPGLRRGSLQVAVRTADDPAASEAALQLLLTDRFAATTARSRDSCLRTWLLLHDRAYRTASPPVPPFPLTPEKIYKISSLFKAGGYLSYDNYLLRAKAEHMALGEPTGAWSLLLGSAARESIRSVGRNAGQSRQSRPLDPIRVSQAPVSEDPLFPGGTRWPG